MSYEILNTKKLKDLIEETLLCEGAGTSLDSGQTAQEAIEKRRVFGLANPLSAPSQEEELAENHPSPGEDFTQILLRHKEVTEDDKKEWDFWEGVESTVSKMMEKKVEERIGALHQNIYNIGASYRKKNAGLSVKLISLENRLTCLIQEHLSLSARLSSLERKQKKMDSLKINNNIVGVAAFVSLAISMVTLLAS